MKEKSQEEHHVKTVLGNILLGMLYVGVASANLLPTEEGITSDFDGDGQSEVALVVRDDPGGSGVFYHLLVVDTDENGKLRTASSFIGDRVQFLNFWHDREKGAIAMDLVQAGKGDAACCPTHKVVRRWKFQDGSLKELPAEPYGQVSINDLVRFKWRLVQMDGQSVSENAGIDLTFGPGKVGGKSGCNNYIAGVKQTSPGKLKINAPMAATQMACPEEQMKREQEFLKRLTQATSYQWMGKTLVLDWQDNGKQGSLVFRLVEE
jgi:heat shock protein HslJ